MKDSLDEGVWPEAVDPLLNRALGLKDYWMGEGLKNEPLQQNLCEQGGSGSAPRL